MTHTRSISDVSMLSMGSDCSIDAAKMAGVSTSTVEARAYGEPRRTSSIRNFFRRGSGHERNARIPEEPDHDARDTQKPAGEEYDRHFQWKPPRRVAEDPAALALAALAAEDDHFEKNVPIPEFWNQDSRTTKSYPNAASDPEVFTRILVEKLEILKENRGE